MKSIAGNPRLNFIPLLNIRRIVSVILTLITAVYFIFFEVLVIETSSTMLFYFYLMSNVFLIWVIYEIAFQRNQFYIVFLFILGIPLQNWLLYIGNTWHFNLLSMSINFTAIAIFLLIIRIIQMNRLEINFNISIVFVIILFTAIISLINTKDIYVTLSSILYVLIIPYLLYMVIISIVNDKKDIIKLYLGIVLSIFLYNILNVFLEMTLLASDEIRQSGGIFQNPNYYAPILLVSIFLSLYLFNYFKNNVILLRVLMLVSTILSTYLLLTSGSRTSLVVLALGFLIFYKQMNRSKFKMFITSILIIIIMVIIIWFDLDTLLRDSSLSTFQRITTEGIYIGQREFIWGDSWNYIVDNKLFITGVGLGMYLFDEIGWNSSHNSFLYLGMQIGLFGTILYHYLIIRNIGIKRLIFKSNDINVIGISLLVILIQWSITGNGFQWYSVDQETPIIGVHLDVILIWFFMAVNYSLNRINKTSKDTVSQD